MYESKNFNYKNIINKSQKVDKKVNLNTKHIKENKEILIAPLYGGTAITIIIGIVIYYNAIAGLVELKTILITIISILILASLYCFFILNGKMNALSFLKLKKMIKNNNYEVYKYTGDIKAIYVSQKYNPRRSLGDNLNNGEVTSDGIKLIIEDQTFYLLEKVYYRLKFDKQITLYFIKKDNKYIFYDYERILNKNSSEEDCDIPKEKVPKLCIVAIIAFILMILILPLIYK